MDYFAHGFWSYIFFHWTKKPWLAIIFGLLPDTASWFIYLLYSLITSSGGGRPILSEIPDWVWTLYGISHSIIIAGLVLLLLYFCIGRIPWYVFAWPIAILMDIPTHTREFLPTPFLWPVSEWHFPGISWGTTTFMLVNYSLIFLCLTYILLIKPRWKISDLWSKN